MNTTATTKARELRNQWRGYDFMIATSCFHLEDKCFVSCQTERLRFDGGGVSRGATTYTRENTEVLRCEVANCLWVELHR